jgi:hypothetical protein
VAWPGLGVDGFGAAILSFVSCEFDAFQVCIAMSNCKREARQCLSCILEGTYDCPDCDFTDNYTPKMKLKDFLNQHKEIRHDCIND